MKNKYKDNLVSIWDGLANAPFHQAGFFSSESYLRKWIGAASNLRVLEIGCGQGRVVIPLAHRNSLVIGVDISPEMLRVCQGRVRDGVINIPAVCADTRHLPFRNGAFDLVFSLGVVEHFVETAQAIREHARVCKSQGTVIVSVPHKHSIYHIAKIIAQFFHLFRFGFEQSFTGNELKRMNEQAGVRVTELVRQEIIPQSTVSVFRHIAAYGVLILDKLLLPFGIGGMTLIVRGTVTRTE